MHWATEEWALEATAKGSCVYIDLKLIKFGSSSSSVGRPSGLPLGLLLLESISTIQFQDSLSLGLLRFGSFSSSKVGKHS